MGLFTALTRFTLVLGLSSFAVVAAVYLMTMQKNARTFSTVAALGIALLAYLTVGSAEMIREMLRKPFVVSEHLFSNGLRKTEVERFNQEGYLTRTLWVRPEERTQWAQSDQQAMPESITSDTTQLTRGELMFRGQCMACHTWSGYRGMQARLSGRDRKGVANLLDVLHKAAPDSPYKDFMPPLAGSDAEVRALTDYLTHRLAQGKKTQTVLENERP